MSTSSTISIVNKDGTIDSIFCQKDGHIYNNGLSLYLEHNDKEEVKKLISLGKMSTLNKYIDIPKGKVHNFDNKYPEICVYYSRDRGDLLEIDKYANKKEYLSDQDDDGYGYLYDKNKWYLCRSGKLVLLLNELLKSDKISQEGKQSLLLDIKFAKVSKEVKRLDGLLDKKPAEVNKKKKI